MSLCKCEETQISKQSCQLGMLIGEIFSTRTSFMRRDSNSWISQKKKRYSLYTGPPTDLSSDQTTKLPLNTLQRTVRFSVVQITYYKLMLFSTLYCQSTERIENLWQKKLTTAIASFALEPTKDPTNTVKSSSMVPYYTSHLFILLT